MPTVQAGLYTQNFGSATVGDTGASLGDGSNIVDAVAGIASVQSVPSSGNALRLSDQSTSGTNNFGNWFLPNLNPGVAVTSFTASFDSLIYNSGGTTPGDTFAFNTFTGTATQSVYIDNVSIQTVPEPPTSLIALAGLACGGFSMWRRRKRA